MTIPEIAIPFGAFLVNWIIPKIMARIASGIFTKEKNNTSEIMPSTMEAIRPERQDRQDRPRTPRPPYEPRQERRPVEAPAEQDVLRDSSLEVDQDEALNEGLPSKPFSELDQEKLAAVSQEVASKIVSSSPPL